MKKSVLFSAAGMVLAGATAAQAQEVGRVISSTPVIQQVAVPRQVCAPQPVVVQQQPATGGGGAVIGAVVGGLAGNQIGGGSGRAAATALGVIGGALLGNSIEGSQAQAAQVQNVQQCTTQTVYENRTTGYHVRYEFNGKEYNVQLPYDPGPTIRLQVTPMSSVEPAFDSATAAEGTAVGTIVGAGAPVVTTSAPVVVAPAPVYPIYPAYAYRPYYAYPPVAFSFSLGYVGGHGHRHHRRWR
ncbi:glycine zipper 2TM domain-containing protein [Ramlibacter sp. RBP-2]|uniref:Glycine zipper 2TM domain-containing protein n=1 Tax=Ramlibacter lithotrophicus TaxID=2606681 RepID=A0A7X6DH68_9BURK|nr:glycine zipper 2TM domain-containing protein [Ramlibacter lithotrophicus]NKE67084.1 glycine zipper 2TM domain-containing protein [Ramlibacter lithotrophicus]